VEGAVAVGRPGTDVVPGIEEFAEKFVVTEGGGLEEVERGAAIEEGGDDVFLATIECREDRGEPLVIARLREVAVPVEEGIDPGAVTGVDRREEFVSVGHLPNMGKEGRPRQGWCVCAVTSGRQQGWLPMAAGATHHTYTMEDAMRRILAPFMVTVLASCAADTTSPALPEAFEVVAGGTQTGTLGRPLDSLVVVRLLNDHGDPIPGAPVIWEVRSGNGEILASTATTDGDGRAEARWRLGVADAEQAIQVSTTAGPTQIIEAVGTGFYAKALALGSEFGCALDSIGDAWCWGRIGFDGQLNLGPRPVKLDSGFAYTGITAGGEHACAWSAAATRCWGIEMLLGRGLPNGTATAGPGTISGGHQFASVDAGEVSTCGVKASGEVWCWGRDIEGNTGSFATWRTIVLTPHQIDQTGQEFVRVRVGYDHTCGLEADGTAWCWGRNSFDELGDTTSQNSNEPAPRLVSTDLRFLEIAATDNYSCGVTAAGQGMCWGASTFSNSVYQPEWMIKEIPNGRLQGLVTRWGNGVGIRSGVPYFWGALAGHPYPGLPQSSQDPSPLPGMASGIRSVALGYTTVCGVRADDLLVCWGEIPGDDTSWEAYPTPFAIPAP
jgi:hypothetical protein